MKQKIMGAMENFSKAMVQPLMYLSAAGILIVIGVLLIVSKWQFADTFLIVVGVILIVDGVLMFFGKKLV